VIAPILGELLRDSDEKVREYAARALSRIGVSARLAVEPLLETLGDRYVKVAALAAVALSIIREERAVAGTIKLLDHPGVLITVLDALKRFGPLAHAAVPRLQLLLRGKGTGVLRFLKQLLKRSHGFFGSDDGQLLLRVAQTLSAIGPAAESTIPDMVAALRNPEAAGGVAWALAEMSQSAVEAVPALIKLLSMPDDLARRNAAMALGKIGPGAKQAIAPLKRLLNDTDGSVRAQAALALWQIERLAEPVITTLVAVVEQYKDSPKFADQYATSSAAEFLGEFGGSAGIAIPVLVKILGHESSWVRVNAAYSIWKIIHRSEVILPVLLEELKCQPTGFKVLECLGAMGGLAVGAAPALQQIIEHDVSTVVSGTIDSYVDTDETFRATAIDVLEKIRTL
jgi:HEAT repeat protein